jgi:hypothetical protein
MGIPLRREEVGPAVPVLAKLLPDGPAAGLVDEGSPLVGLPRLRVSQVSGG